MRTYKKTRSGTLYSNTRMVYPFQLTQTFSFPITVNKPFLLEAFELSFGTYLKICQGTLSVTLVSGNMTIQIDYPLEKIKDNVPVRFIVPYPLGVKKSLHVSITTDYKTSDIMAIWINENGPCCKLDGRIEEFVKLKSNPLVSVVVPVYRPELEKFKATVLSVTKQIYDNYQLILVDDNSKDGELLKYLKQLKKNKRVVVLKSNTNLGISEATNLGISKATGEYVCFLDHDDCLELNALLEVANVINTESEKPDLIYTDEDKIMDDGTRYEPHFKSDWNYELLLSQNYICHLAVYRTALVKKLKGLRKEYDGSQDYDLLLRVCSKTNKIVHIPKILYHWRASQGSTALGMGNKILARSNAEKALSNHLSSEDIDATIEGGMHLGTYHVNIRLDNKPCIPIIIPFKDNVQHLKALMWSISRSSYEPVNVILVNNRSEEKETLEQLEFFKKDNNWVTVCNYPKKFNYSAINNWAVKTYVKGKYDHVLFLNNDVEAINRDWLEHMVQHILKPDVGIVGAKLLYPDHRIQHAGVIIGIGGVAGHSHKYYADNSPGYFSRPHIIQRLSAVTGACMLVKMSVFEKVGGFEEKLPRAFNDIDFCLKVRGKGLGVIYTPYAKLYHYESATRGLDNHTDPDFAAAIKYMQDKWQCNNYNDPYYNINFSTDREDCTFTLK